MAERRSAGILLFRRSSGLEVLLGLPGGPYFARRDLGHWTIPKGEPDGATDLLAVARREFEEETGHAAPISVPALELGTVIQKGGKIVHCWAIEGDLDPAEAHSNTFELEWPPRSGRVATFPEIARVDWFGRGEARIRISAAQAAFLDRLDRALGDVEGD